MPDPKKKLTLDSAYVAPTYNRGISGGASFSSQLGNSSINGVADANNYNYSVGHNYNYPLNNYASLQGNLNYNSNNYGGIKNNNLSGSIGANYSRPLGKNTDIDITSSLQLNKEGLTPNFQLGLRKRFGEGGYTEDSNIASLPANKLNRFFFTDAELEDYQEVARECYGDPTGKHKGCAQGSFDMNVNEVAPHLGLDGIRKIQQDAIGPEGIAASPYSIKSKPRKEQYADKINKIEFMHNNSIDSWELYKMYNEDPNVGSVLWSKEKNGRFGNKTKSKEWWGKIPLGAIITQGNTQGYSVGSLTAREHYGKSSHTTTVVGYAEDGCPLVYDDGKVSRLGNSTHTGLVINDIYVPKGYEDFTFGNMKNRVKEYNQGLGYRDDDNNAVTDGPNQYSRSYVNDIKNALDENEQAIGQHYNINKSILDKIQNRVIGIGAQESNLNNFGDIKEENSKGEFKDHDSFGQRWGDNPLGNSAGKPVMKYVEDQYNIATDYIGDLFDNREQLKDWEVEILAEDKLKEEGVEFTYGDDAWREYYNELRSQYDKKSLTSDDVEGKKYVSSRGAFKIKNFPDSATKLLKDKDGEPLTLGDLNLVGGDVDELRYGANVAAILLAENYNRFKKKYNEEKGFNLTDDQLIDLATVAYNNNSKSMSELFVKRFIMSDTLKDGYLSNAKRYESLYLEEKELQPGESTKDDEAAENSSMSAEDLEMLKKNAAAAEQLMAQPPAQQAYGGPIAYGNGGNIKNNTMNDQNFMNAMQMMYRQNMQRQQMAIGGNMNPNMNFGTAPQPEKGVYLGSDTVDYKKTPEFLGLTGSQWGAGTAGALQGVAGSVLPGKVGDMAVQGIGSVHGMIDKDVTEEDKAIMGGARAVGAVGTAIATGGTSLAAGADDIIGGTTDAVKGTEWGQKNAETLDMVGGIAATAAGGAAGGAANGGGMEGAMKGVGNAFGMPGGANAGGTPGIAANGGQGMGGQGGIDPQQIMQLAQMFGQSAYGGPIMMAQGGKFSPHPMYKDGQMVMANDMAAHLSLKEQGYGHEQMKNGGMIKRADGSYSKRGLWDNIRANAGSGKKPTEQMLAQERKIKMEQGGLMSIENGGTHEQNPMGGVPVGPNASVEEGETIMDLVEGGKFVFSDRKGPKGKKGQTWSDISKRVERKYKDRDGDEAAKRAMNQELLKVAEEQEEQKAKEMAKLQAKMNELAPTPLVAGMEGMPQPGMMPPQGEMAPPPQMGMPDPGMMQQPQQGMPPGMPPQMGMGGMYYGYGGKVKKYGMGGPASIAAPVYPAGELPQMVSKRGSMMPMGNGGMMQQPMHQMPDGTMMPGAVHGESVPIGAYGYGGGLNNNKMNGVMFQNYGAGGMLYGYGGKLEIPQEDIGYIEQMIDFELAHGSADGTGLSYGAWSDKNASDRDSAIEFIYNKYVTPNKDLPVELRKRAADMHLNSEDPRASLMVAAGVITPAEKLKLYNVKNPKTGKGMINPDDLDKLWGKNKDKVEAKYSDPKFVEDFDKEKHRSYSGLGDMYKNSQKYRIDMWNPKAANYRNPSNYKNTDYDGGQPTVGSAQFGTKAQDVKQGLNTALGADASVPDFLQGDFGLNPNKPKGFLGKDIDGNPAWIGGEAPEGAMAMDPNDPNDPRNSSAYQGVPFRNPNDPNAPGNNPNEAAGDLNSAYERPEYVDPLTGEEIDYDPYDTDNQQPADNLELADQMFDREGRTEAEQRALGDKLIKNNPTMPDVYPGQNVLDMMQNSNVGGQEVNTDFLNQPFDQTSFEEVGPMSGTPPQGSVGPITGLDPLETPAWQTDAPVDALNNEQYQSLSDQLGINTDYLNNNPNNSTQPPYMTPEQLEAQKQKELIAQREANGENPDGTLNMQKYKDRGFFKNYEEEVEGSDYNPNAGRYKKMTYEEEVAKLDAEAAARKTEAAAREQEEFERKRVRNRNLGIGAGTGLNMLGDIHNLKRGLKGPEEINYDRIKSDEINLHNQRMMLKNQAAGTVGNIREGIRKSGSIGDMITGQAAVGQNLGQGLAQSYLNQDTTNIGIRNKDKILNQQIDTNEQIANQQAKAASSLLVNEGLHGIGSNLSGGLKDVRMSNQVDRTNNQQIASMNSMFKDFDFEKLKDIYSLKYGNKKEKKTK